MTLPTQVVLADNTPPVNSVSNLGNTYNPFALGGAYLCFPGSVQLIDSCYVGDLASIHTTLQLSPGAPPPGLLLSSYTNPYLPLFGPLSIIGRSLLVQDLKATVPNVFAAALVSLDEVLVTVVATVGPPFQGIVTSPIMPSYP